VYKSPRSERLVAYGLYIPVRSAAILLVLQKTVFSEVAVSFS
jgi:hypothetical protein